MLVVRVPVLSEHIIEVQPSVSTDSSLRTIAFFLAILLVPEQQVKSSTQAYVPNAKHVVMTAGSPSGIAATARATAILK